MMGGKPGGKKKRVRVLRAESSTFHLHVLGLAELLLAGFLLLLLCLMVVVMVVVHVCDLTVVAAPVVVLLSHALVRVRFRFERTPESRRMRVRIGAARVRPGLR